MSPPRTHARVIRRLHVANHRLSSLPGNLRGILWMLVAGLFFTTMVTLIKLLGARLHVTEIILIRQIFMAMIVAPTIVAGLPGSLVTRHGHLHALRIACASVAMFAGFTAVVHLPLADATALSFSKTFFVTIFAILFLGETVGRHRWLATIAGFIGVLVILRPDAGGGVNLYAGLAVAGAAAAAVVMILIRKLSQFERPVTILTYQAVFVGVIMLPFAIANWKTPTPAEWGLLVIAGFVSWAGQMCNIRAFRAGEASAIAAFDYVRLLYATAIGFLLFSDLPGLHTLAGATLIVAAALYTAWREAYLGKKVTTQSGLRSDPP
ncbi:DMT family transporter [Stappia taiwanensis]|uniref:DMT family transporter n=1 Tax=Stappia taiwanensis TaxID=992267 RepID=A0A838XKL8_9HYPH|nr:DMT family transporter [Stappia taiwanensis]MBA4610397.1 DMT family transporter [Stappia taiwanensis]